MNLTKLLAEIKNIIKNAAAVWELWKKVVFGWKMDGEMYAE
jgi:hypothetical protein